eukprot:GHVO01025656.1.p1 GENE.GHVO01025656.1~~GHVO01025656.1.p1  ORF type:complete len:508 (-),score=72.24 GHVO01025656.1:72-1595(-)
MEIPLLGFNLPTWLILLVTSAILLYKYLTRNLNVLKDLGYDGPKPYPIIGTFYNTAKLGIGHAPEVNMKKYGKVYAEYSGGSPVLVVGDIDILKKILVKDFGYFTNRRKFGEVEAPLDKMLTVVDDDEWKNIRNAMTPAFSGGKLRKTTRDINDCAENMVKNLGTVADEYISFEVKKFCGSYSADVLARVAFGVDIDSQNDPDHPFIKHMTSSLDFSFRKKPYIFVMMFMPSLAPLAKKLGWTFFGKEELAYFTDLVNQAIEVRKNIDPNAPERNDFLQIMLDAKEMKPVKEGEDLENKQRKPLTDADVLSNCIIFFFAAYGTIGDTMSMILFALADNPEVQEQILEEINNVLDDSKKCSYDQVKQLGYLDMVVDEALRLYAPAQQIDRLCSQDVVINGLKFPKDVVVNIPVHAIHMDPEKWPEPEKFIPERFSPENKAKMNPYHWLPFGYGPRNCVGMRMALVEVKIALVHMIRNFRIVKCDPDQKLERNKMTGAPIDLKLKVERR